MDAPVAMGSRGEIRALSESTPEGWMRAEFGAPPKEVGRLSDDLDE
jgi:hypothetical protein